MKPRSSCPVKAAGRLLLVERVKNKPFQNEIEQLVEGVFETLPSYQTND
jgi:hypothetical protein